MLRSFAESGIFGEAYGTGEVRVVWLHGWARSAADFAAPAGQLAERDISSVALDLPGSGASPPPARAGGASAYAELLSPVLEAISPEPLVVVGHSFGGRIAVILAARYPARVRALVLTGVPLLRLGPARKSPPAYRATRWMARRGLLSDARLEAARQRYGSSDYRNATGVMRDVLVSTMQENYEGDLGALRAPVTLLWGEQDAEAPLEVAHRVSDLLGTSSNLEVLAGVGHFVPLEASEALAVATHRACQE
ncbi:MAG TPA: alpha/beta hydrolase [Acidimicrobiales bacterium]